MPLRSKQDSQEIRENSGSLRQHLAQIPSVIWLLLPQFLHLSIDSKGLRFHKPYFAEPNRLEEQYRTLPQRIPA